MKKNDMLFNLPFDEEDTGYSSKEERLFAEEMAAADECNLENILNEEELEKYLNNKHS